MLVKELLEKLNKIVTENPATLEMRFLADCEARADQYHYYDTHDVGVSPPKEVTGMEQFVDITLEI